MPKIFKDYSGNQLDLTHVHKVEDTKSKSSFITNINNQELLDFSTLEMIYYTNTLTPTVTDEMDGELSVKSVSVNTTSILNGNIVVKLSSNTIISKDKEYILFIEPYSDNNTTTVLSSVDFGTEKPYNFKNSTFILEEIKKDLTGYSDNNTNAIKYKLQPFQDINSIAIHLYTLTKSNTSNKKLFKISIRESSKVLTENTATVSNNEIGFMAAEDKIKLEKIESATKYIESKLEHALFYSNPSIAKLIPGTDFNTIIKTFNLKEIEFTNYAIPKDKIDSAVLVSAEDSDRLIYAYSNDTCIYISPEEDNLTIYANEDCSKMFWACKLTKINMYNLNTFFTKNMYMMFQDNNIQTIDVSNLITDKVKDMGSMFSSNFSLLELDLSNFITSNCKSFMMMFVNCQSMKTLKGVEYFDVSKGVVSHMFNNCKQIIELDLSRWIIRETGSFANIFSNCESLETLKLPKSLYNTYNNNIRTSSMNEMFSRCKKLKQVEIPVINPWTKDSTKDGIYAPRMFYNCNELSGSMVVSYYAVNLSSFTDFFKDCSTVTGSRFVVNYKKGYRESAELLISTKSENSNVVLGVEV